MTTKREEIVFRIHALDGEPRGTLTLDQLMTTTGVRSKRSLWAYTAKVGDVLIYRSSTGKEFTMTAIRAEGA